MRDSGTWICSCRKVSRLETWTRVLEAQTTLQTHKTKTFGAPVRDQNPVACGAAAGENRDAVSERCERHLRQHSNRDTPCGQAKSRRSRDLNSAQSPASPPLSVLIAMIRGAFMALVADRKCTQKFQAPSRSCESACCRRCTKACSSMLLMRCHRVVTATLRRAVTNDVRHWCEMSGSQDDDDIENVEGQGTNDIELLFDDLKREALSPDSTSAESKATSDDEKGSSPANSVGSHVKSSASEADDFDQTSESHFNFKVQQLEDKFAQVLHAPRNPFGKILSGDDAKRRGSRVGRRRWATAASDFYGGVCRGIGCHSHQHGQKSSQLAATLW